MTEIQQEENWNVPETEVLNAIKRSLDGDEPALLATVVAVEGSAYRQPGAKMVITEDGIGIGGITAGCLEDEVRDIADQVLADGRSRVERFDLTSSDEDVWGLGLGCNGVIDVLFEPLDEYYRPVIRAYESGKSTTVLTVVEGDHPDIGSGSKVLLPTGKFTDAVWLDGEWPSQVVDELHEPVKTLLANEQSDTICVEQETGKVRVFIDSVTPPPELVIFGTGHDVQPVVEIGRWMDFRITVVGFRGSKASSERFPHADRVLSTSPTQIQDDLDLDTDTYAVLMTHNYIDDQITLDELLQTSVPYIGLMGPTERFQEMLEDFADEGRELMEAELERVYTPIGLSLGGGTPYQIALSIIGEVQAIRNDRVPKHLRDRKSSIHDRIEVAP